MAGPFSGAVFSGAVFSGAVFSGAAFSGVAGSAAGAGGTGDGSRAGAGFTWFGSSTSHFQTDLVCFTDFLTSTRRVRGAHSHSRHSSDSKRQGVRCWQ
ncbi:MAG: pentapeptide repeat-containing protein [Planctomycetaceae bacterium]